MSSSDSNEIPLGKLIPKKLKKKTYFSSKYGKISAKSSSEDSDDDKVNEGASSSINTFGEKDGLVFTNSDFNVTCNLNDLQRNFNGNLDRNFYLVSKNTLILRLGA